MLHIDIPLMDYLEKHCSYVKFMKEILSKKRKFSDCEIIAFTGSCSIIIDQRLPPRIERSPIHFIFRAILGSIYFWKAFCDVVASINFMPLSIFKKFLLGEVNPNFLTLLMVHHYLKRPEGVIEDVLVKVY